MIGREHLNSFLFALFGFEKVKSRKYLLFIILIHAAGWFLLFLLPLLFYPVRIADKNFYLRELIDKSLLVGIFYLNYYVLIPRFFLKKKYGKYCLVVLLIFFAYLVQNVFIRVHYFNTMRGSLQLIQPPGGIPVVHRSHFFTDSAGHHRPGLRTFLEPGERPLLGREERIFGVPDRMVFMSLNNTFSSFALLLLIGAFIRLTYSFIMNQNEKKALENANLNAEVNFLKSQINPHFLFNTLNSIYVQAHSRSVNTEFSILKLSELLRYVLYDSGEDKVELSKDIRYITNYIDLQRLRLSPKIILHYSVEGDMQGKMIAPLLLINFIENAFKHGISYTQPSTINIAIRIFEKTLTLSVTNPILEKNSFAPGGLGLKNVTRRLELLYRDQYQLDIRREDTLHIVNLKLELTNA